MGRDRFYFRGYNTLDGFCCFLMRPRCGPVTAHFEISRGRLCVVLPRTVPYVVVPIYSYHTRSSQKRNVDAVPSLADAAKSLIYVGCDIPRTVYYQLKMSQGLVKYSIVHEPSSRNRQETVDKPFNSRTQPQRRKWSIIHITRNERQFLPRQGLFGNSRSCQAGTKPRFLNHLENRQP